jgi:peptidyl-prolyl cis-trans isomerase SurA
MAKMNPALRDYLTKLREDAYIEIKGGYEDSGASPNEMKPVYSAYEPPKSKKKHVQRTRFKERGRKASRPAATETAATTAPAPPAGVPSLADAPQGSAAGGSAAAGGTAATAASSTPGSTSGSTPAAANTQTASTNSTTLKPGKKEKIRFGQAPRETLPTAPTKTEDASAGTTTNATQVATNNAPGDLHTMNPDGSIANPEQAEAPKQKTRFADRAKLPKEKKNANKNKVDPFAPPPITQDEVAAQQQQAKPLGLNGDTSKSKKPNPAKTGPKRRMTDQKKNEEQPSGTTPSNGQPPAAPATTGSNTGSAASAPAPSAAPATQPAAPATPNQ